MTDLLAELHTVVGADHVLTGDGLAAWEQDWRRRQRGRALAVVRPGSTAEVAAVVRACAQARQRDPLSGPSLVPQGGNTGLVVGGVPDASGRQVVLSLQRMNRLRALDADNLTLTAEAGCVLSVLQQQAQAAGFLFPLSLAAEGSCTIGGNLATNAGGTQVLRYGNARELCLGVEVVTAQGDIWNGLTGLRKDNTGYDLRHLMIGSEGTLGIITAATLKLYPLPVARLTAWVAVPSVGQALALLRLAHRHLGPGLTGFELMGQLALDLVARHLPGQRVPLPGSGPWAVLLENSDHESADHARARFDRLLEEALETGCASDAVLAHTLAQAEAMWQVRESIPLAQAQEGLNIKHDIAVPISAIPDFVAAAETRLQAAVPGVRIVNFGHLGDGNLHFNVQAPEHTDPAAFLRDHEAMVNELVFDTVQAFGGSFSAEHGIGGLKVGHLARYKPAPALAMMRAIKQALDPLGLLNPGRVLA
ncbi:MAG: FAD-binding oxidoreductase [Rhodoferax sp.]|nr:FAD-binding oxidoreductase [Rhodoferax sp.]